MTTCPHISLGGADGPIAELGHMPSNWVCDECGAPVSERWTRKIDREDVEILTWTHDDAMECARLHAQMCGQRMHVTVQQINGPSIHTTCYMVIAAAVMAEIRGGTPAELAYAARA